MFFFYTPFEFCQLYENQRQIISPSGLISNLLNYTPTRSSMIYPFDLYIDGGYF